MSLTSTARIVVSLSMGLLLVCWSLVAAGRELAAEPHEMVEVEVATVAISGSVGPPVVLLREPGNQEVIPIFIGPVEAGAILRGLRGDRPYRPKTHDLFSDVMRGIDAKLQRVYVDALVGGTFMGMLEFDQKGRDEPLRIDSRPSDAIALALYSSATIHISPKVREAARQISYQGLDDEVVTALGVTVNPVTADLRDALNLPYQAGLLVSGVSGPADEAGLQPGAMLLEVNGQAPESPMSFLELVRATPSDETVHLRYWQEGKVHDLELSTEVPSPRPQLRVRPNPRAPGISM